MCGCCIGLVLWNIHTDVRKCFVLVEEVHIAEEVKEDTSVVGGVGAKDGHTD